MGNKIYRELLGEFDIKELWHFLSSRHNLPPIRAERLYKAYCGAREEILALPSEPRNGGILRCELVAEDNGGAPDSYFHCTIFYPADAETYAVDFIDWAEIVNCEVDGGCLQKYGALVVTAEILWEVTFYGYSRATVNGEGDKLKESVEEITTELESDERERHTRHADDFLAEMEDERERRKNSGEEKAFKEWFSNAPECVKARIFEKLKADVLEDDDVSDEVFASIVQKRADESTYKYKGCDDAESLICTMLNGLDYDDMAFLAGLLINEI